MSKMKWHRVREEDLEKRHGTTQEIKPKKGKYYPTTSDGIAQK